MSDVGCLVHEGPNLANSAAGRFICIANTLSPPPPRWPAVRNTHILIRLRNRAYRREGPGDRRGLRRINPLQNYMASRDDDISRKTVG
jgi:hypothetical protein